MQLVFYILRFILPSWSNVNSSNPALLPTPLYSECLLCLKVVDHYENPRNVGNLDKQSKNVGTGLVGAPACGDVMKLQVCLSPHTDGLQPYTRVVKSELYQHK